MQCTRTVTLAVIISELLPFEIVHTFFLSGPIVYIGGNDVAAGNPMTSIESEIRQTLRTIDNGRRRVFLCTVCPRRDVDVQHLNAMIRNICCSTYAELIDVNPCFTYGDGSPASNLMYADGIHLNAKGSNTLVKVLDRACRIIRSGPHARDARASNIQDRQQPARNYASRSPRNTRHYCERCDMTNHDTWNCRRNYVQRARPVRNDISRAPHYRRFNGDTGSERRSSGYCDGTYPVYA